MPLEELFFIILEVIAVQPELELAWQEFESASTYAYAQREALTKIDRSEKICLCFRMIFFVERLWIVKRLCENLVQLE